MNQIAISPRQLLALMILFEFGTAIVIHVGLEANHVIWLSILFALPGGILLYLIYTYLLRQYPDLIVSGYIRAILGPIAGWPICLFLAGYFLYNAARNLREAGDLLITSVYDETPLFVMNTVMILAMIYVLGKGVEVFFRLAQFYLFIITALGIAGFSALLFSGELDFKQIWPYGGADWLTALKSAYPSILTFPFGEIFCFATVLPLVDDKQAVRGAGVKAIVVSGTILAVTHAAQIAVLGESIYKRSTFPLLTAISIVDIANFLQRLDALVMLTLIICVFFKMSMYCYAVMAIMSDLFRMPSNELLASPVGIVVLFMSIFSAWSFPEHAAEGRTASLVMLLLLTVGLPLLLVAVHAIKKGFQGKQRGEA